MDLKTIGKRVMLQKPWQKAGLLRNLLIPIRKNHFLVNLGRCLPIYNVNHLKIEANKRYLIIEIDNTLKTALVLQATAQSARNCNMSAQGFNWVHSSRKDEIPAHAVVGGQDKDGSLIYVGRAQHKHDLIPAKIVPERQEAYVAYKHKEHKKKEYEVLCEQRFEWVPSAYGAAPTGAVIGGRTNDGEDLYIGRVCHQGSNTVGKVHPSHGCLYIPYGGQEVRYDADYEVLVLL